MRCPFMILSHHRSGSNFVHDLVQAHPRYECISEPFSMHSGIFRDIDLVPWLAEEFDDTVLHPYLTSYPETIQFLQNLRDFLVSPYKDHARGMKETMLFEKLGWVNAYVPDLKIVFLVRDPRAVVHSIVNRAMYRLWNYSGKIPVYMHQYYPEEVIPVTPAQLSTWSWKIRIGLAYEMLNLFDYTVVRLEDIVVHPEDHLPALMDFLGDEMTDAQWTFFHNSHHQTRGKAYSTRRSIEEVLNSWKEGLSHDNRQYIESHLREEMVRLGYL